MSTTSKYVSALVVLLFPIVLGSLNHRNDNEYLPDSSYSVDKEQNLVTQVERNPEGRLGFVTYGNDLQGYHGSTTSVTPLKIELGGVFLGTLLGFGLVLLAPKLSELFNHHHHPAGQYHGAYSRREDQSVLNGFTKVMAKIDEALQENHIDSMSCLERATCTYVQSTSSSLHISGSNSSLLSSNPLLNFVIDGSKLKTALDRGLNGENCSLLYPQCSFSKSALVAGIRSLIAGHSL